MSNDRSQLPGPALEMERAVDTGDFCGALEQFHGKLDPAVRELPEVELLAATAAARLGDWEQATTLGLSLLEHGRRMNDVGGRMQALHEDTRIAPHILQNLASVAHIQGRTLEALARYREAITMYQSDGNDRGLAEAYHNIGLVQRQEKGWSEALEAVRHAMRHALVAAETSLLALVHLGSAELDLDVGEFERAQGQIDAAGQLLEGVQDQLGKAELERVSARMALAQGNPEEAHSRAVAGEAVAASGGSPILQSECAAIGAAALQQMGADEAQAEHDRVVETMLRLGVSQPLERFERQWAAAS